MTYFARISSQSRPANKLQQYILILVEKYNNVLLDDPEALATKLDELTRQANRAHPRCTKHDAKAHRDYKTKEINSIGINGLVALSLHKVAARFTGKSEQEPQSQPEIIPQAVSVAAPPAPPAPEPAPVQLLNQPRQPVNRSREDDTPLVFEYWHQFSPDVQRLLAKGQVWAIYKTQNNEVLAEEFGGITHPAYS